MDQPIVCDMTSATDTGPQRMAEYGRLFAQALVGRERTAGGGHRVRVGQRMGSMGAGP